MPFKLKIPTPYSMLFIVICIAALLTYILPSGKYATLTYDVKENVFQVEAKETNYTLPATQTSLSQLNIPIEISTFTDGKIKKSVSIPDSYYEKESNPQGFLSIIFAPIKGIYDTIDIILFVLILGGFIAIFNHSGALNTGVGYLAHRLKGREGVLIIVISSLIALGGTSFGLAEETFAFYPILVPIFLAARYDAMVPLAVIYLGSAVGTMASTINPFAVIVASDAVGVDWTTGLTTRAILLILGMLISIIYIIRYAEKVRKDPTKSVAYGAPLPETFNNETMQAVTTLNFRTKLLLCIFGASFLIMIFGVSKWGWWFQEMTALFFVASLLSGFIQRMREEDFVLQFINGTKDLLGVAFIIGIARGVTFILNDGQIADTILFHTSQWISGMSPLLFLPMLMLIFAILTLFISSSSGMAVITMPIMGGLATIIGVEKHEVVNAYLFGMGLMSFIAPTGLILPSLAMVNLNLKQWFKFVTPLLVILTILSILILWCDHLFHLQ